MEEKRLIKRIEKWVKQCVRLQKRGQPVFSMNPLDTAKITAGICGTSRADVFRIRKENDAGEIINFVQRPLGRPRIFFDDFDKKGVSRLILGFYTRIPPELPTLDKIWTEALQLPGFPEVSRKTLYRLIIKLGFVCKQRKQKMHVYQRMDIVAQRHKVLKALPEYRAAGYTIFYQDETWCNANHTRQYIWQYQNNDMKTKEEKNQENLLQGTEWNGGLKVPIGSGRRVIVNDIGSSNGFVKGVGECFIGKTNSGDYHSEMNSEHFEKWWSETVLPKLPDKSIAVIDNAKYHSRQTGESKTPTTSWRKPAIREFLDQYGKHYDEKDTIPSLLRLSGEVFLLKKYVLETITENYCGESGKDIKILRLLVGHSELNPIELIWAQAKNEVAKKNVKFNITSVRELMTEALRNVSRENWAAAVNHVIKVEAAFRAADFGDDGSAPQVSPLIIELNGDDDDSDSDVSIDDEDDFLDDD